MISESFQTRGIGFDNLELRLSSYAQAAKALIVPQRRAAAGQFLRLSVEGSIRRLCCADRFVDLGKQRVYKPVAHLPNPRTDCEI